MAPLDKLLRRLLNFWLLEYTPGELWTWLKLHRRRPDAPAAPRRYGYTWRHGTLYFDRIVVISLPFRTDRRTRMQQRLNRLRLVFSFFDALHGQTLSATQLEGYFSRIAQRYLPPGSMGCALSHAAVWRQVLEQKLAYCLIFEDDVLLPDNFIEQVRERFREVPDDFDLVLLGSGKTAPTDRRRMISAHVFEPFYPREGLYGYVVSARGAQRLLQHVFPIRLANGGIDTIVGKLVRQGKLRAYHLWPVLCEADLNSPSNIPNPGGRTKPLHKREKITGNP